MMFRNRRRGSVLLEFTLVGIPLIFVWISIVQMAIGMWRYHTLQNAVKIAGSFVTVHGFNCTLPGNSCAIQIRHAAQALRRSAVGLPPDMVTLQFRAFASDHVTVAPVVVNCTLDDCLTDTTSWPPVDFNEPGCDIEIRATYGSSPGGSMVGPGGLMNIAKTNLPAYTRQMILF